MTPNTRRLQVRIFLELYFFAYFLVTLQLLIFLELFFFRLFLVILQLQVRIFFENYSFFFHLFLVSLQLQVIFFCFFCCFRFWFLYKLLISVRFRRWFGVRMKWNAYLKLNFVYIVAVCFVIVLCIINLKVFFFLLNCFKQYRYICFVHIVPEEK